MSITDLLNQLGLDAKKSLGQNFMVEEAALDALIKAAGISPDDVVLEIGAGLGALTAKLAQRARRIVALEIDQRFITYLTKQFADRPSVEIVHGDILETDIGALLGDDAESYKVVANLPYYITSAILRYLLECPTPPDLLVVTVQYEVAKRIAAQPGNMSLLAVGVQFYGTPKLVARLKPGHFYPVPGVDSAIVRIDPHPGGPPLVGSDRDRFFHIVRAGFSQPRKQVKNSLSAGLRLPSKDVIMWLGAAQLDPRRRAETFSISEWLALYQTRKNYVTISLD